MKLKLTNLQIFRLRDAYKEASAVLNEIKIKRLTGDALSDMKLLEQSVQGLEILLLGK